MDRRIVRWLQVWVDRKMARRAGDQVDGWMGGGMDGFGTHGDLCVLQSNSFPMMRSSFCKC